MRKFLNKIILYLLLLGVLTFFYTLIIYFRPDLVDAFYYKFTTEKANSFILGTSRPAQGIKPEIINKLICTEDNEIINHSFAIGPSSYGPNYYREITNKLSKDSIKGIFVLSVDPWSLATGIGNINDDSLQFFEARENLFVGNLKSSSNNPNFDYLLNYWGDKFSPFVQIFKLLINYKNLIVLHSDGWLEVSIAMDSASVNSRIQKSTEEYKEKKVKLSNTRFYYLDKIIALLKNKGDVFLVRLPVSSQMAQLEKDKFSEFDKMVQFYADKNHIKYFNFIEESGKYRTIDTHHLYKKESERFTYRLCDSISTHLNTMSSNQSHTQ
ncbi:MAG: hypothetical protein H8D45_19485 [Bacteroidetes bacterium]|nr:hypothetical protein [Bacteroidota bacterium]MBL7104902.1 hypothetical protein [Bacteroidales bacterium]